MPPGDRDSVSGDKVEFMFKVLTERLDELKADTKAGFESFRQSLSESRKEMSDEIDSVRKDVESVKTVVTSGDQPLTGRVKTLENSQQSASRILGVVATALVTLAVTVSGALIVNGLHLIK